MVLLVQNYLPNCKQYVYYDGTSSDLHEMMVGVAQGSILGPLSFIISINDVIYASELYTFIVYADDTRLSTTLKASNPGTWSCGTINNELIKFCSMGPVLCHAGASVL